MSFRQFIYYCALCGGCAAYVGWALGRWLPLDDAVAQAALKGLLLGMALALSLGLIDALWNFSGGRLRPFGLRVLTAGLVGCLGGFVGGGVGQILFGVSQWSLFLILGWTVTGLLIGASVGMFDFLASLAREEEARGARRKLLHGVLGGTVGGLLGGVCFLLLQAVWKRVFRSDLDNFWSPSATGFVALGLCIGLLIGLAQVILKEAWLRVKAGFRPGRELILAHAETTLGRAESCDVGLFGDPKVEKTHARIRRQGDRYLLSDAGTSEGTFLNGERIARPTPLRSGDEIRIGKNVLRFGERQKRAQPG